MNRSSQWRRSRAAPILTVLWLALCPLTGWGHAFPEQAAPGAGAHLATPPQAVVIRFDRLLEAAFSGLRVTDGQGRRVDAGDGHVDPGDARLLKVSLPHLATGTYRVTWTAVARDGHRTSGDYTFTIQ